MTPPKLLPRVTRLLVEKGDVVVVECPGAISEATERLIEKQLRILWPHNKVLILQEGMTLKIGTPARKARVH